MTRPQASICNICEWTYCCDIARSDAVQYEVEMGGKRTQIGVLMCEQFAEKIKHKNTADIGFHN